MKKFGLLLVAALAVAGGALYGISISRPTAAPAVEPIAQAVAPPAQGGNAGGQALPAGGREDPRIQRAVATASGLPPTSAVRPRALKVAENPLPSLKITSIWESASPTLGMTVPEEIRAFAPINLQIQVQAPDETNLPDPKTDTITLKIDQKPFEKLLLAQSSTDKKAFTVKVTAVPATAVPVSVSAALVRGDVTQLLNTVQIKLTETTPKIVAVNGIDLSDKKNVPDKGVDVPTGNVTVRVAGVQTGDQVTMTATPFDDKGVLQSGADVPSAQKTVQGSDAAVTLALAPGSYQLKARAVRGVNEKDIVAADSGPLRVNVLLNGSLDIPVITGVSNSS